MNWHIVRDFIGKDGSKKSFIAVVAISIYVFCSFIFDNNTSFQIALLLMLIYIVFQENIDMARSPIFNIYIFFLAVVAIYCSLKFRFTSDRTAGITYAPVLFVLYWPLDWMAHYLDKIFKFREKKISEN